MSRVRVGVARHKRRKRMLKKAKGYWGGRHALFKSAKETVIRAEAFATRDRRNRKREMRRLWITRISAACSTRDINYSRFMHGLAVAEVGLNRKELSELAIRNPEAFDQLVELAKSNLAS
ncbi:MAG: 50S ribosomal protein L20 [Planctomycetota bacterium]